MNYFDYLRATKKEDNVITFMQYLMDILNYSEERAEREKKYYYF